MELTGIIVDVLPITSGTSKNGKSWKKQEVAIEVPGQYPKIVAFSFFGDKCESHGLIIGQEATIHINIESRKYNDRYFTEVSCWKVDKKSGGNAPATSKANEQRASEPVLTMFSSDESDDLPF